MDKSLTLTHAWVTRRGAQAIAAAVIRPIWLRLRSLDVLYDLDTQAVLDAHSLPVTVGVYCGGRYSDFLVTHLRRRDPWVRRDLIEGDF